MPRPAAAARAWMLAVPAILTSINRASHSELGGGVKGTQGEVNARAILKNAWGIDTHDELVSMIRWLMDEGTTAEYFGVRSAGDAANPKLAFVRQHQAQIGERGLMAFDLCRVVSMAGWGALSGLCTEDEAWGFIVPSANKLQKAYKSWEDVGEGYTLGCAFWNAKYEGECRDAMAKLKADPSSPWNTIPWKTDLSRTQDDEEMRSYVWAKVAGLAMSCLGAVAVAFVCVLGATGMIGYMVYSGAFEGVGNVRGPDLSGLPEPKVAAGDWDGSTPLICNGNQMVSVSGVHAVFTEGAAITASANCNLTLDSVDITAPTALRTEGNATVTVNAGHLVGGTYALDAAGNSHVTLSATKLDGPVNKSRNAKVEGP
jgi:hypothetical protein